MPCDAHFDFVSPDRKTEEHAEDLLSCLSDDTGSRLAVHAGTITLFMLGRRVSDDGAVCVRNYESYFRISSALD